MTLYTAFRRSAERFPEATALEVAADTLSYRQLDDLVDRLAGTLTVDGRPPAAVGLLAARSVAAYAGYLAALRVGATVVPLNPNFPAARNAQMCEAGGVQVLIVDERGAGQADELPAGLTVRLTGDWRLDAIPRRPDVPAYRGADDDVAYTLFTSGSTGRPKGVPIRHRMLAEYLPYCVERYEVGPGSRLSQTFDLTFDPSVFDMFVAWSGGAALVVPQPDEILTPVGFVAGRRITHWFSVPSVVSLARRLRALRPGSMPALRWSLFAGEQLTAEQARGWAAAAPGSVIENVYGPTELTITCTGYRLPADPGDWPATSNGTVPIGRPYPHLDGVVLDEAGALADDGELCVRGSQRFDGYVDAAHDEGRFVRHGEGDAFYRTGDRVRVEHGELTHLGRLDDQVKIHGYRIELGEIEAVLRRHPGVHDAVVLALGAPGPATLDAVYTGDADAAELEALLRDRLPSYMVPQRIRHVPELPVNVNGKTDRRRLAQLADSGRSSPHADTRR